MKEQTPDVKRQTPKQFSKNKSQIGILNFGFVLALGVWILAFFLTGCGSGQIVEQITPNADSDTAANPALSLSPQENVFAAASFFTDTVGSVATVGLNSPHSVAKARAVTDSSDIVLKSFDNKLFVINRGTTGTIQVIDPASFKILGNYSVGAGSNPQDLIVANGKAFITRLDSQLDRNNTDDLLVVDPLTGVKKAGINLKPFTDNDGDRLARAASMALAGDILYILIQDLSKNFEATTNGKIAILDTRTNTLVDADATTAGTQAIALRGRNPTDIAHSAALNLLFVANTGRFSKTFQVDLTTDYGGVETVDLQTNTSRGIVIDDRDLGGYVSTLRLHSETLGAVTIDAVVVALFNPKTKVILDNNLYNSPGGYLSDLLFDKNGLLWIPERNPGGNGLVIADPQAGARLFGPVSIGAYPSSMTLIK